LQADGVAGEIIVADNGSEDGSLKIAKRMGVRVIHVKEAGYGNALMAGIAAARGEFVIMGDADDSYDFGEIPKFLEKLREGYELVQGCRLPAGGGTVAPGAMPLLHRWIGNPLFSALAQRMFRAPIHDVYCGMRGFTKELYQRLDQRCTGMEFATEMVIKSSLFQARITETPITLHPDGRKKHAPHLRTLRDGWRTLRFFLICSPRWSYFLPGSLLLLLGLLGYALAMPGFTISAATFDAHTLLFASLSIMMGYQAILFAVFVKVFAASQKLIPEDRRISRLLEIFTFERSLLLGGAALLAGAALLGAAVWQWWAVDFGELDYARTMRLVIPGVTLAVLGFQSALASLFISILNMRRK
jgi:glycosyltransferase involved in cell wall biosynthesis